jgi:hypothetical protein
MRSDKKKRRTVLLICLIGLAAAGGASFLIHARHEAQKRAAMHFCEELAPLVSRSTHDAGHCPPALDPSWIAGKQPPALIDMSDFYSCQASTFDLRFRSKSDFWNYVWDYHCDRECVWLNYD